MQIPIYLEACTHLLSSSAPNEQMGFIIKPCIWAVWSGLLAMYLQNRSILKSTGMLMDKESECAVVLADLRLYCCPIIHV